MTNEKLESKLADLLNVSSHEESITFALFKKKVAESLKIGEALKVNKLGVFQLKEQLENIEKSKKKSLAKGKNVLIFSPESDGSEKESLFLTLEIEPSKKDSTEFDESVFNIGIGKPTVPIGEKNAEGNDTSSELSIDEKISNLITSAEKLENYDLWDDYLDGKQSFAGLIDEVEEEEIDNLEDYLNHDDSTPNPNDFVELDEEELLSDFESSEIIIDEELVDDEVTEEVIPEVKADTEVLIEQEENAEKVIDVPEDIVEEVLESENISDEKKDKVLEETPIETEELISDVINVEEDVKEEVIEEAEIKLHEEVVEPLEQSISAVEAEDKKIEEPEEEQALLFSSDPEFYNQNKEEEKMAHPGMNNFKKGYSPTIIALIVAFFIVGSIGIYYLFFDNPTWLYDQNEVEVKLSEKHAKEFEEAKKRVMSINTTSNSDDNQLAADEKVVNSKEDDSAIKNESNVNKKTKKNPFVKEIEKDIKQNTKKTNVVKKNSKKINTEKSNTKKTITSPKVATSIPKVVKDIVKKTPKKTTTTKTSRVGNNNIFFDGTNYSVQISSWKQQSVAEQEVARLKKKGYSAYVMKAYIPKFKANWHRVRIGNIATLKEAQSIQKNVK